MSMREGKGGKTRKKKLPPFQPGDACELQVADVGIAFCQVLTSHSGGSSV